ncbi:hypothetical protein RND81_03G012300 [Saponaria officinalis]|uniref:Uncharacterized protein n=1 Tax=Saponaria officinalis TaxID=3572 RepID=A0AAW1M6M5_SAPOF
MKSMKVQTEQWRKATDAAAAVLAGGVEINGRMPDMCASMDNHFSGIFKPPIDGYGGYLGSPGGGEDNDDGFGREKKKSSRIRMFGELWKKKGQNLMRHLLGVTEEEREIRRDEILSTRKICVLRTSEEFVAYSFWLFKFSFEFTTFFLFLLKDFREFGDAIDVVKNRSVVVVAASPDDVEAAM